MRFHCSLKINFFKNVFGCRVAKNKCIRHNYLMVLTYHIIKHYTSIMAISSIGQMIFINYRPKKVLNIHLPLLLKVKLININEKRYNLK